MTFPLVQSRTVFHIKVLGVVVDDDIRLDLVAAFVVLVLLHYAHVLRGSCLFGPVWVVGDVLAVGGDLLPRVELLVAIEVAEKDLGAAVGVIVSDLDLEQLALGPSCQLRNKGTKFETEPTTKTETNI